MLCRESESGMEKRRVKDKINIFNWNGGGRVHWEENKHTSRSKQYLDKSGRVGGNVYGGTFALMKLSRGDVISRFYSIVDIMVSGYSCVLGSTLNTVHERLLQLSDGAERSSLIII